MPSTKKPRTVRHGTGDIAAAMRKKYSADAYALLFEVGNSTGFQCSRHADAICMSLWPSRGLDVSGFEFKASRTDWQKELKDPAKAEAILQYCDFWWLVIASPEIVKAGELPSGWGLMSLNGRGTLDVVTPAARLNAKQWPREFIAAVLRSAADPVAAIYNTALMRAREEGRKSESEYHERQVKRLEDDLSQLRRQVTEFEHATGVAIATRYGGVSAREFKLAIESLNDKSLENHVADVQAIAQSLDRLRNELTTELAGIEKLRPKPVNQ